MSKRDFISTEEWSPEAIDGLLGLQMAEPAAEVQRRLFGEKVLVGTASDPATLRLLPPLSFSAAEADLLLAALGRVLA